MNPSKRKSARNSLKVPPKKKTCHTFLTPSPKNAAQKLVLSQGNPRQGSSRLSALAGLAGHGCGCRGERLRIPLSGPSGSHTIQVGNIGVCFARGPPNIVSFAALQNHRRGSIKKDTPPATYPFGGYMWANTTYMELSMTEGLFSTIPGVGNRVAPLLLYHLGEFEHGKIVGRYASKANPAADNMFPAVYAEYCEDRRGNHSTSKGGLRTNEGYFHREPVFGVAEFVYLLQDAPLGSTLHLLWPAAFHEIGRHEGCLGIP